MELKLEAGRDYRREDGAKVRCLGENPLHLGWFVIASPSGTYEVNSLGMRELVRNCDLIEEWREPRTEEGSWWYVLVDCPHTGRGLLPDGKQCDKCRVLGRKLVEVSITEGDGM